MKPVRKFLLSIFVIFSVAVKAAEITEGTPWDDTLLEFSLSGKKAKDGRDGKSYRGKKASNGSSSGSKGHDGRDGHDGEKVRRAEDAKKGRILLQSPSAGVITFSGSFVGSKNKTLKAKLKSTGFFRAVSRGGNGAMPGFGGWGEEGGNGARGADGGYKQAGEDGGNGGTGGDAGSGHNGGDAGDGKEIRIGIPAHQLELAWTIEGYSLGGIGGTHSEHGRAGRGGSGGAGGTGDTWSEQVTKTRTVSYTDSDGNRQSKQETYTVTVWHKEPDGSRGSDGSSGRSVRSSLRDGAHGKPDKVIWEVLDAEGNVISEAEDRYQVQIVGFRLVDYNNGEESDGIFEPGERGYITDIFVRNTGKTKSPEGVKTRFRIKSGAYFYTSELEYELPEGLEPGEVREVKGEDGEKLKIPFQIKDFNLSNPSTEPFVRRDRIVPVGSADIIGVKREIPELAEDSAGTKDFTIQFPVLIEPITTLPNLAPGEASKYIFRITNISGRDFGSESELKKFLEFEIKRAGGDVSEEGVQFFDQAGNPLDINQGFLKEVMKLKANESTIIETIVGVSPGAESYRMAVTNVELRADRNGFSGGEDLFPLQRRVITLNISDNYFKTPDSDFLLVTNNKLSRPGYESWKRNIERKFKSNIDVWDLSYKNFISFIQKLGEYNEVTEGESAYDEFRTSLAEDFKGKTIILQANSFSVTGTKDEDKTVWDYINMRDLRAACALYDINLYIIGEHNETRIRDLYVPRQVEESLIEYSTYEELVDVVEEGKEFVLKDANIEQPYWERNIRGTLSSWRLFTQPGKSLIKKRAKNLFDKAMEKNPDADFSAMYDFVPKRTKPIWSFTAFGKEIRPFGSYWEVGDVSLWRSIAPEMGNVVVQRLKDWDVVSPNFIDSDENIANLLMSRSFEENLKDLEHFLSQYDKLTEGQRELLPVLIKVVEKALVLEQESLRKRLDYMPSSKSKLGRRLQNLQSLSKLNLKADSDLPMEVIEMFGDMLLNVYTYTKGQRKWWERFLLLNRTKNAKVTRFSMPILQDIFTEFYQDVMPKEKLKEHLKLLLEKKKKTLKSVQGQSSWKYITLKAIDIDQLIESLPEYRGIMSQDKFDAVQAQLEAKDVKIDKGADQMSELREELIVDNPILLKRSMGVPSSCKAVLSR